MAYTNPYTAGMAMSSMYSPYVGGYGAAGFPYPYPGAMPFVGRGFGLGPMGAFAGAGLARSMYPMCEPASPSRAIRNVCNYPPELLHAQY